MKYGFRIKTEIYDTYSVNAAEMYEESRNQWETSLEYRLDVLKNNKFKLSIETYQLSEKNLPVLEYKNEFEFELDSSRGLHEDILEELKEKLKKELKDFKPFDLSITIDSIVKDLQKFMFFNII